MCVCMCACVHVCVCVCVCVCVRECFISHTHNIRLYLHRERPLFRPDVAIIETTHNLSLSLSSTHSLTHTQGQDKSRLFSDLILQLSLSLSLSLPHTHTHTLTHISAPENPSVFTYSCSGGVFMCVWESEGERDKILVCVLCLCRAVCLYTLSHTQTHTQTHIHTHTYIHTSSFGLTAYFTACWSMLLAEGLMSM